MSSRLHSLLAQTVQAKEDKTAPPVTERQLHDRLAVVYARMEEAYNASAHQAGLTCADCPTNCCTSFFQHHTYIEWSYLWRGLHELAAPQRKAIVKRAKQYVEDAQAALSQNTVPDSMCPLNEDGLCILYPHRLMICRMHGTRNVFRLPSGQEQEFSGCARFVALPNADTFPPLDRTPLYEELAAIELALRHMAKRPLGRVRLTLAEMIVQGAPALR